jgi:hypothetical protein
MEHRKASLLHSPEGSRSRVRLDSVRRVGEGDESGLQVTLSLGEAVYSGSALLPAGEDALDEVATAVEATLKAVEQLAGTGLECTLVDSDIVQAFHDEQIVVLVTLKHQGEEHQVFGRCREREDVTAAAARATLDAVNQYLRDTIPGTQ